MVHVLPIVLIILSFVFEPTPVIAEDATITRLSGKVQILSLGMEKSDSEATTVKFEGNFYTFRAGKVGLKVIVGNIIQTGLKGKVRLVYPNGDQIHVGSATSYRILKTKKPEVKIDFGKVRAQISKKGRRKRLGIRTMSATLGVRGTDFYVYDSGRLGQTEVSVLRGQVNVTAVASKISVQVKPGYSVEIPSPQKIQPATNDTIKTPKAIQQKVTIPTQPLLRKTTQFEFDEMRAHSQIQAPLNTSPVIAKLEKKAILNQIEEIRLEDPSLYQRLKKAKSLDAEALSEIAIEKHYKSAPRGVRRVDELKMDPYEGFSTD